MSQLASTPPQNAKSAEQSDDSPDSEKVPGQDSWLAKTGGEAGITVGLVTLLLFLRMFAVADWNWTVVASLTESFNFDDAFSILLGTLFERPTICGILIAIALPLAIYRDYWLSKRDLGKTRANNWFIIVVLLATAYVLTRTLHMWWVIVWSVALTALLILVSKLAKRKGWRRQVARLGTHVGIVIGVALLAVASTVDTPWVEREQIVLQEETIYGYVLDSDPGFLKIMTDDREILITPDSDVVSRTIMD